jgi:hypothetical protein
MPYEISYYDEPCGAITKFFGVVTNQDLLQSGRDRIQSVELYEKFTYLIDDYSIVEDIKITADGIRDVSTFAVEISVINKNIKFLAILPTEHLFILGTFWKLLSHDTGWEINIVKNQEEAQQWIKDNIG